MDATTGLHTEPALDREIREFLEESGQGTLLKIGLDQFSHINVMYGAAFSDKILNCAAQELLRLLRGKGYGTLYEGDERGPQPSDLCVEPFPA